MRYVCHWKKSLALSVLLCHQNVLTAKSMCKITVQLKSTLDSLRTVQVDQHVKPGIEIVQALADISRSLLLSCAQIAIPCGGICCHSNETRAPIANPPNSAQLGESTPNFRSMSVVAKWLDGLRCHLVWRQTSAQATLLDGNPARLQARGQHLQFWHPWSLPCPKLHPGPCSSVGMR